MRNETGQAKISYGPCFNKSLTQTQLLAIHLGITEATREEVAMYYYAKAVLACRDDSPDKKNILVKIVFAINDERGQARKKFEISSPIPVPAPTLNIEEGSLFVKEKIFQLAEDGVKSEMGREVEYLELLSEMLPETTQSRIVRSVINQIKNALTVKVDR